MYVLIGRDEDGAYCCAQELFRDIREAYLCAKRCDGDCETHYILQFKGSIIDEPDGDLNAN